MVNPFPDSLLPGKSKRQIDSIKGHPVDVPFPVIPVPPCGGVAQGAHVLIVPESVRLKNYGASKNEKRTRSVLVQTRYLSLDVIFIRTFGKVFGRST